jgi:hypothetical protein
VEAPIIPISSLRFASSKLRRLKGSKHCESLRYLMLHNETTSQLSSLGITRCHAIATLDTPSSESRSS